MSARRTAPIIGCKLPLLTIALATGMAVPLSGCAYRDLKAPCAPDEAPAASSFAERQSEPEPFASMDRCGALRPLNRGETLERADGDLHRSQ